MAKKRGRPRKNPLPEEIQTLVKEVESKQVKEEIISDRELPIVNVESDTWDVSKDLKIEFFDTNLSYELTGYKPITKDKGIDFDPDWFTEARQTFLRTGHYTLYRFGSKACDDFWDLEYYRCINGMESHGYRITGDNYFFLNYFLLLDLDIKDKAGSGRSYIFPAFYAGLYELFHYIELCRMLRLNACIMKSREVNNLPPFIEI